MITDSNDLYSIKGDAYFDSFKYREAYINYKKAASEFNTIDDFSYYQKQSIECLIKLKKYYAAINLYEGYVDIFIETKIELDYDFNRSIRIANDSCNAANKISYKVEEKIYDWQQKQEYESTSQYEFRVNSKSLQAKSVFK